MGSPQIDCRNHWKNLNLGRMSPKRKTPDLMELLDDPEEARKYIAGFDWNTPDPPKYIVWGLEERIVFEKMTDAEAIFAAKMIVRDIVIPMELNQCKLERWEQ